MERVNTYVVQGRVSSPSPPGDVPYLDILRRTEGGRRWLEPDGIRRTPSDWEPLVAEMSDVQKMVHLTARWTGDDIGEFADRQFGQAKATYEQALTQELRGWGCSGSGVLGEGPELTAVRERADWASTSVAHTYNYELAKEINRIGEDAPKANRHVYAYRLYHGPGSWDKGYWVSKNDEIAKVESMTMINAAKADFYERNPQLYELQGEAWVIPLDTVCPICESYVSANPYDSMEAGYRQTVLPAHVNCPHFLQIMSRERKLQTAECADLWAGI